MKCITVADNKLIHKCINNQAPQVLSELVVPLRFLAQ